MNKLLVFPVTQEIITLLRYPDQLSNYKIQAVASFKEDIQLLEKCKAFGVETVTHPEYAVTWDSLLLDHSYPCASMLVKYTELIEWARMKGRDVILTTNLAKSLKIDCNGSQIRELYRDDSIKLSEEKPRKRLLIPVPVIAVMGAGVHCSKFEVQLLVKRTFEKQGFRALGLSANQLAPLCGMHSLPKFLTDNAFSWESKIIMFNHYVSELCEKEQPDVIVITIPAGIEPLTSWDNNFFAELPLIISTALSVDIGIFNFYFTNTVKYRLDELIRLCRLKFGIPIDLAIMSRQILDNLIDDKKTNYLFLDDSLYARLLPNINESPIPIIGLHDEEAVTSKITSFVCRLKNNYATI